MATTLRPLPSVERAPKRARLLLVDDVEASLVALRAVLEPLGQELVAVRSGDEALTRLLHDDYALIVMDVRMPGLDGLQTARLIRERERTRHVPIIFITGESREAALVTRGYAQGAVDYLLKPVDPDILRAKASTFVELYLRGEQLKEQALVIAAQQREQEELKRASELEQLLLGIVGHDLRNPLSSLLLSAKLQLGSGKLEPEQREAFARIVRSGERMARIADLLLDVTRVRLGGGIPITRVKCDVLSHVRSALDELRVTHPDRRIELHAPRGELWGAFDGPRLSQVVSNLVDNALRYGTQGAPVTVRVTEEALGAVRIRVHNLGPEIPPETLSTLFAPFRRGEADDTDRRGLGLGLYISEAIVKAHGGTLQARSRRGEGTTFEVNLPRLQRSEAETPGQQPRGEARWAGG